MKQIINGTYIERICLESGMLGLKEGMKKFILPCLGIILFGGLNAVYMSENLKWGYSNPETKDKISLFQNTKKELNYLKDSKNKLLAKCYFPFYSELSIEDSKNLSNLDKKIFFLDKNKSMIKADILKKDEYLYANYFGGKFLGGFMSLTAIVGSLFSLGYYYKRKKEIIREAKESHAYWDLISK